MTFVLILACMVVIAALAALRHKDFKGLDSRPAEVPARDQKGGAGAGCEDPASVPEAFTTAPRTAALRLVRSPRQDVTQPTPDDDMAAWDREWNWPAPDDAA